jgi:hypothetical protein
MAVGAGSFPVNGSKINLLVDILVAGEAVGWLSCHDSGGKKEKKRKN